MEFKLLSAARPPQCCITGASGLVGRHIYRKLLAKGYQIRVLSRNRSFFDIDAELFIGDIRDINILMRFLSGADVVFHCAAELNDKSSMWDINVNGTKALLNAAMKVGIRRICFLSSAGVIGACDVKWVDEYTVCSPQDDYEKSKYAAEQLVARGIPGCSIVILRPTNVIDAKKPGAVGLPLRGFLTDKLKAVLKGGECAHIVHASDVADAAIYLLQFDYKHPELYFVSCDEDTLNTFAGLWSLCQSEILRANCGIVRPIWHLPLEIPHLLRRVLRGHGNRGNVRFSSGKLRSQGFTFPLGVTGAVRCIVADSRSCV